MSPSGTVGEWDDGRAIKVALVRLAEVGRAVRKVLARGREGVDLDGVSEGGGLGRGGVEDGMRRCARAEGCGLLRGGREGGL